MTVYDIQAGYRIMEQALEKSMQGNRTITELRESLITYSVIIFNLKNKLIKLEEENKKYSSALLAIQENNLPQLKDELMGAYNCLGNKLESTSEMLELVKLSGGTIGLDFVIEYNETIKRGLDTLIQLVIKTSTHEDFDISTLI